MFYSQLNNSSTPMETVRCGLSCFSIHCHIPRRNIKASSSASFSHKQNTNQSLSKRIKKCIQYLWISRISIQFNSIPCLILLLIVSFISIFLYIEQYNGYYYYQRISTLSFLYHTQTHNNGPSLYDLHQKLSANYPNAHVIAGPPLSRKALGHISWLFLHTQSVTYPEEPTEQRKKDMIQFWESFSRLYPCGECAKHMREKLKINPPKVDNNKIYSKWLCEFHNGVTKSVKGKHLVDCNDINGYFEKWSPDEFCGCDNEFIEGVDGDKDAQNILSGHDTSRLFQYNKLDTK